MEPRRLFQRCCVVGAWVFAWRRFARRFWKIRAALASVLLAAAMAGGCAAPQPAAPPQEP